MPYLLVNIGSGVSILRVNLDGSHERIGGTSLGGATFYGLCSLVTGCSRFSEALELAEQGTAANVDLLVADIYGGDYAEYGLTGDIVAASMGKLIRPDVRNSASKCDIARGILDAITNNIVCLPCSFVLFQQPELVYWLAYGSVILFVRFVSFFILGVTCFATFSQRKYQQCYICRVFSAKQQNLR